MVTRVRIAILDAESWIPRIAGPAMGQADFEIAAAIPDPAGAADRLAALAPALLILDVRMPGLDGFGLLRSLRPVLEGRAIIVTEAEDDAARAFDEGVVDFVVKPFAPGRLTLALERARVVIARDGTRPAANGGRDASPADPAARAADAGHGRNGRALSRLAVRTGERILLLNAAKVSRFEAAGNYVKVFAGGERYLIRRTLSRLEEELDPDRFRRIHRSAIVNLDHVVDLRVWFGGDYLVRLTDGSELRLSRRYRRRILG